MLLLELAVQGIRGFSPAARAALTPGYLVLRSPTEFPAPVSKLLMALCYNESRQEDEALKAPGAAVSRVGFSVQGTDDVWRLMRDLGGAGSLYRLNRETRSFDLASNDAGEIVEVLRGTVGFPDRATYENLFMFSAAQLPTRKPRAPKPQPGGYQGSSPSSIQRIKRETDVPPAENIPEAKAKIAQLEAELEGARAAGEIQFTMDGLQGDVYKLETQLAEYEAMRAQVEAARAEAATAPTAQSLGLPEDIIDRVGRFGQEKKRHDEAMHRLMLDREEAGEREPMRVPSVMGDTRFLSALGAGLALLALGVVTHDTGARFATLLAIPSFSFAALLGLRYVEDLQHASKETAKIDIFAQREKKLKDEFEMISSLIQTAFDRAGAATADDFYTIMARRAELEPELQRLESEFAEYSRDPAVAKWPSKIREMKAEYDRLNDQLMGSTGGGYTRDVREVERELARVRESVKKAEAPAKAAEGGSTEDPVEDPMPSLMSRGAAMFAIDIATMWNVMRDRTIQYLTALTDRRYVGMEVDAQGNTAVTDANSKRLTVAEMPARDVDIVFLSARLTLVEKFSAQTKLPVVLEDAFGTTIDPTKQALFARMLKHLGTLTQVLHVVGSAQQLPAGTPTIAL